MILQTLKTIFNRDLNRLKQEIELYQNESQIWTVQKGITNSAGNLCLHLVGNLNTYIGATFGNTNYARNRELEFSLKDIPKIELIRKIEETSTLVACSLDKLTEKELLMEFPLLVFETTTSTEFMLIHLTTHLTYHLGQINYHRRLLEESSQ
ncbi:Protein of unknown function [Flavobacterium gillisiae]|uniref:DinB superfamily protein n=1 Tax=Flavobacterium gillisiae TaxID=150146 RepID=A0A1H3ZX38_9FLAO|nr:DUF1572 family protein [Flavobacterium gillisiae]SEA28225.1 Protein of unknown function [Flavobacterium gillisiae]